MDPAGQADKFYYRAEEETDNLYYRTEDEMGESGLQWAITHLLVDLLGYYFECQGRTMLVSGNQYIYFRAGDTEAGLAPDVYVIADEGTPADEVGSWKTWEHGGRGPCLAVEVVSDGAKEASKDYDPAQIEKYEEMGVKELVRYDPHWGHGRRVLGQRRRLLTHWVRDEAGKLQEQPVPQPDRVQIRQFGFWLMHGMPRRLYLGTGPEGLLRWPTRAEAAAQRADEAMQRAEAAEMQAREIKDEGAVAGEARGKAKVLLKFLAVRLGPLEPEIEELILDQRDMVLLDQWLNDAVLALTTEDAAALLRRISKEGT